MFYFYTGYLALTKCGYDIEVYYACEIDKDALLLTKNHFGDNVYQLGSVTDCNEETLSRLGKINLLIGGSPCSDLSLVNNSTKGLYGMIKMHNNKIIYYNFVQLYSL